MASALKAGKDATQEPTMKIRRISISAVIAALALAAALACGACGGSDETAAATTTPAAPPSVVPAAEPESQWDAPGDATVTQARAVGKKWSAALTAEKLPGAGIYSSNATWDYWPNDDHIQGGAEIEGVYAAAGADCDWSKGHDLSAPGVVAHEGVLKVTDAGTTTTFPALALLAVDGEKVVHEEVFLDPGSESKKPVTFCGTAPGPKDTAKVAAKVATAVGDAFAAGDVAALQTLLAPHILFYDTGLRRGVIGVDAVLAWQAKTPALEVANQQPIAAQGWALVRWTVREVVAGTELAMPGATVMEVRDGKVVRMTLYYDGEVISLQG